MDEQYRFTVVITGDLTTAKVAISGEKIDAETGEKVRDLTGTTNDYANLIEAAVEAGYFMLGFGLSTGRRVAFAAGDAMAAAQLTAVADVLGIPLRPLDDGDGAVLSAPGAADLGLGQTPAAGTAETVKAALSAGIPGVGRES